MRGMDEIEARLAPLYSVLLGLVALGSCLQLGPDGTAWDTGGAPVVFVIAVVLMLAWAAAVPQRTLWPTGVLAGTAAMGAVVVAATSDDGPFGTGGQLLVTTFVLTAVVAAGHVAAFYHLTAGPEGAEHRADGATGPEKMQS
jgi:hypothetical protein